MSKPVISAKIAILVANGFNEQNMTLAQRALQAAGANARIIGMDQGLVNGWSDNENAWGHHFAVDSTLSTALAVDYAMLVVPGGRRSLEKLKLTAHTKRFIGGFMDTGKPVAAFNDALEILAYTDKIQGRLVAGPESLKDFALQAGAQWAETPYALDRNLLSGSSEDPAEFVAAMIAHFSGETAALKQAA